MKEKMKEKMFGGRKERDLIINTKMDNCRKIWDNKVSIFFIYLFLLFRSPLSDLLLADIKTVFTVQASQLWFSVCELTRWHFVQVLKWKIISIFSSVCFLLPFSLSFFYATPWVFFFTGLHWFQGCVWSAIKPVYPVFLRWLITLQAEGGYIGIPALFLSDI